MELKTLKDIEFGRTEKEDRKMLKEEAIKWIKTLEKNKKIEDFDLKEGKYKYIKLNTNYEFVLENGYEESDSDGAIKILKHFFNITEEDLK